MSRPTADVIRGYLMRVAQVGLSRHEFAADAARVLRRAVPFDGAAVIWFDPATAVPVDTWLDYGQTGSAGPRLPAIELGEADVSAFRQLAASDRRAEGPPCPRPELL